MKKICIIGSGSWGVALAIHATKMGHDVNLWSYSQEEADMINNEHKCKFLPMATIPEGVKCTTDIEDAIRGSDMILHVTPSKFTRETVKKYKMCKTRYIFLVSNLYRQKRPCYTESAKLSGASRKKLGFMI